MRGLAETILLFSWLVAVIAAEGSTIVAGIKQYQPNCLMLSGFRKEECQQNKENAGLSGVSWWAWVVLGVVLTLIILVVFRMMCASYRGGQQQQPRTHHIRHKHRQGQDQSQQLHHHQQQQQGVEMQQAEYPVMGLVTIPEYGGEESYHDQQEYIQYPHYYYPHPHYLHYPPYTEGGEEGEGDEMEEARALPYAHVRYANSDTVYTV